MIIAWHIRSPNSVKRAEVIAFVVTGWLLSRTKYLYMPRKDIILFYIYMHIYVCMCLSYLIRPLKQEKTDMCVCNMISFQLLYVSTYFTTAPNITCGKRGRGAKNIPQ